MRWAVNPSGTSEEGPLRLRKVKEEETGATSQRHRAAEPASARQESSEQEQRESAAATERPQTPRTLEPCGKPWK